MQTGKPIPKGREFWSVPELPPAAKFHRNITRTCSFPGFRLFVVGVGGTIQGHHSHQGDVMSTSPRPSSVGWTAPVFESLEPRQFLSVSLASDSTPTAGFVPTPVRPVLTSAVALNGRGIYA